MLLQKQRNSAHFSAVAASTIVLFGCAAAKASEHGPSQAKLLLHGKTVERKQADQEPLISLLGLETIFHGFLQIVKILCLTVY